MMLKDVWNFKLDVTEIVRANHIANNRLRRRVLIYRAHIYFVWSLLYKGTNIHLSYLHYDDEFSSRTTHFKAGR
jgi:hypothetical protein